MAKEIRCHSEIEWLVEKHRIDACAIPLAPERHRNRLVPGE